MDGDVIILTDKTFGSAILEFKYLIVLFYDPDCPHCKNFLPEFSKIATELKKDKQAVLETEIGQDMRIKGVVSNMDGVVIQKVPSTLMPRGINYILSHRVATTQAIKLAEYKVHNNVPFVSGSLVEGRIYYTAFVRNNKKDALYVSTEGSISL